MAFDYYFLFSLKTPNRIRKLHSNQSGKIYICTHDELWRMAHVFGIYYEIYVFLPLNAMNLAWNVLAPEKAAHEKKNNKPACILIQCTIYISKTIKSLYNNPIIEFIIEMKWINVNNYTKSCPLDNFDYIIAAIVVVIVFIFRYFTYRKRFDRVVFLSVCICAIKCDWPFMFGINIGLSNWRRRCCEPKKTCSNNPNGWVDSSRMDARYCHYDKLN